MTTIATPRVAVAEERPADLTIQLRGHCLDYRDTAEVARILSTMRLLGFVPRAEWDARPGVAE